MSLDVTKLAAPIAFKTGNENTIVNLNDDGNLVANRKTFSTANIFRWMRTSATKAANNEVRTAFLRSLGEAFGIEGATVGNDGKTRFSKAFMDNLEKLLGADFKRADFGIGKDGIVASGKPLTERRISAIVTRALIVGKGPFDAAAYRAKVDQMQKMAIATKVPDDIMKFLNDRVARLGHILDFLQDGGIDGLIEENDAYEEGYDPDEDPNYNPRRDAMREYPYLLKKGYDLVPLRLKDELSQYLFSKYSDDKVGGIYLHFENVEVTAKNRDLKDSSRYVNFHDAIKNYVHSTLETYVKLSVDMFYDTLGTKTNHQLIREAFDSSACIEGQTTELIQFQGEHDLVDKTEIAGADGAKQAAPVNLAVADHTEANDLFECLAREAQVLERTNHDENKDLTWDDYRPVFVKNLVGLVRPVQIEENGPVETRKVTEADIDALRNRLNDILFFE